MADKKDKANAELVESCFGDIAVTRGLVTAQELAECRKIRDKKIAEGTSIRMGEVMMQKGLITKPQALDVLKAAHNSIGHRQKIGGYELIEKLGEGAMGAVYKANQISMNRIVALKLLPRSLSSNENIIKRFMREARIVANLNHPNIVRGFEIGEANGYHFFAMEFVDGGSVDDKLKQHKYLEEKETIEIAMQCCKALEHAHNAGVIHRDIKPDNLMLTGDGVLKVADLGLATREDTQALTATGNTVGTPYYMSPEQVTGQKNIDLRADIYALGATLYHLCTGEPPFTGSSTPAIMSKRLMNNPVAPCNIHSHISKSFSAVLLKMMSREPADRYQNCGKIISDLELLNRDKSPECFENEVDTMISADRHPGELAEILGEEVIELNEDHEAKSFINILPVWITPFKTALFCGFFFICAASLWVTKNYSRLKGPSHPEGKVWTGKPAPLKDIRKKLHADWKIILTSIADKNKTHAIKIKELEDFIEKYPGTALSKRAKMFIEDLKEK
ncbi:MAG: serine/threonine protein kinase [Planctomycetota bacterium]|jgi:serine/threonine-protein kinase